MCFDVPGRVLNGFARSGWMRADAIHTFGYLKRLAELDMSAGRREIRR